MSLLDSVRDRLAAGRIAYQMSHDRVLGKSVWARIQEAELPPEYHVDLAIVQDHQVEVMDDAWHRYVGEVARECPRYLPRHLRLRWVVRHLALRRRSG